jgi:hypothetical protein
MGAFRPINEGYRWDVRPVTPPETKTRVVLAVLPEEVSVAEAARRG